MLHADEDSEGRGGWVRGGVDGSFFSCCFPGGWVRENIGDVAVVRCRNQPLLDNSSSRPIYLPTILDALRPLDRILFVLCFRNRLTINGEGHSCISLQPSTLLARVQFCFASIAPFTKSSWSLGMRVFHVFLSLASIAPSSYVQAGLSSRSFS